MIRDVSFRIESSDFSARVITDTEPTELVSPAEMTRLRTFAEESRVSSDLLQQSDAEVLKSLRLLQNDKLTFAGLLLVGKREAIQKYAPNHEWQYAKMRTDVDIEVQAKGSGTILAALEKLEDYTAASNPITTIEQGFQHLEFKTYPSVALREGLLNAFVHRDFLILGQTNVRVYADRLDLENLGGFMEDITPENILHHPPVPRNPLLADALTGLNLVNRQNLGVKRIFKSFLSEDKEPPVYSVTPKSVRLTFFAHRLDTGFLALLYWIVEKSQRSQELLTLEMLLTIHYLKRHREADVITLSNTCQLDPATAKELFSQLESLGAIEHVGFGKGLSYRLTRQAMNRLGNSVAYDRDKRLSKEAIKTRVLSVLSERPLHNREIREICDLDRAEVKRLMNELRGEGLVRVDGKGRYSQWHING